MRALYIKDPKRNFKRKIREAKLASELEEEHSKTWILQKYLNSVPYGTVNGRTAIGVRGGAGHLLRQARQQDLKLHEAALLAGLPQAPSQYNPFRNPARRPSSAATRCCEKMAENGYITRLEYEEAATKDLGLKRGRATCSAASPTSSTTCRRS